VKLILQQQHPGLQHALSELTVGSFHAKSTSFVLTIHHTISDCLVIFFLDSIHRDMLLLIFSEFYLKN